MYKFTKVVTVNSSEVYKLVHPDSLFYRMIGDTMKVKFSTSSLLQERQRKVSSRSLVKVGPRDACAADCPDQVTRSKPWQNDPYRINLPEVTTEPVPPSEAKPMIMCPCRLGGGCSPRGKLCVPPTPPPPPPPPFPFIYLLPFPLLLIVSGLVYKFYLYKEERDASCFIDPEGRVRKFTQTPRYKQQLPDSVQYLIIGAGTAAMAAYSAIKDNDPGHKVLIIGAEDMLPYEKSPISGNLWFKERPLDPKTLIWWKGEKKFSMLYAKPEMFSPVEFLMRQPDNCPAVAVATGWKVGRVDADERTAYIETREGEQPIKYKKCLIATGSKARYLDVFKNAPREVRNRVIRLGTVRDAEEAFRKLRKAERLVVVGGGLLASELAWSLGHLYNKMERDEEAKPVEVVHIVRDKGILRRIIPDYLAEWAAEKIKDEGVVFLPKTEIHDAYINEENDRLCLYLSNEKTIETDFVIQCVGANPNTDIAKVSLLEVDPDQGGFVVNTEMMARTDLYVAGDAASVYRQIAARRSRQAHVRDAITSGCLAGLNMTGHSEPYNVPTNYHLVLGDVIHMEAVGEVSSCLTTIGVFAKNIATIKQSKDERSPQTIMRMTNVSNAGLKLDLAKPDPEKPCYKKTDEYRKRYQKGVVYYLRDETIVGVVFWNMDKELMPQRKEVVAEILRAEPTFKDIEVITELLKFHEELPPPPEPEPAVQIVMKN